MLHAKVTDRQGANGDNISMVLKHNTLGNVTDMQ